MDHDHLIQKTKRTNTITTKTSSKKLLKIFLFKNKLVLSFFCTLGALFLQNIIQSIIVQWETSEKIGFFQEIRNMLPLFALCSFLHEHVWTQNFLPSP
jgi:hypothetical protein